MAEKIRIDLNEQQNLYLTSLEIVNLASEVVSLIQKIKEDLPTLSSQGYFHERMTPDNNDGMARYYLKAQEFQTLSEVISNHIKTTHQTMEEADEALAVYIANLILNDPNTSESQKETIRENPEQALETISEEIKKQK